MSIVSMTLLALLTAAAITYSATPQYQSTARVFISNDTSNANEAYFASAFSTARVKSYADLVTSGEVMTQVIDNLDLDLTPRELAAKTTAAVQADTVIIRIQVRDPDPRLAQQLTQSAAEVLTEYLDEIETPKGKSVSPIKASVTDRADFNADPVYPRPALNLLTAGVLGLLIGVALAVARDLLDNTIKSPTDLESVTESPVMAHITYDPNMGKTPLLTDLGSHDPRSEAFRLLRTNLQFLNLDEAPKAFVISSAVPGEGKTSTSVNLAIALAQTGSRVLLVDGDLRRPQVASVLGLETAVGLTTVLVGRSDLESSIQTHTASGIKVLSSGPIPPNPTEVLQSQATRDLLWELREQFDVVVIDAPPLLPVADAAIMATDVDGAILVVRHGKTTKEQVKHAMVRMEQIGARCFGVVVNMTPRRGRGGYGYGYQYGYGYGYEPVAEKKPARIKGRRKDASAKS